MDRIDGEGAARDGFGFLEIRCPDIWSRVATTGLRSVTSRVRDRGLFTIGAEGSRGSIDETLAALRSLQWGMDTTLRLQR
jgi:hypothetical protein